jgi:predicted transcriptional regulator
MRTAPSPKNLPGETDDLASSVSLLLQRKSKPRRTIPCSFRFPPKLKELVYAAAKKHEIDQSEIARAAISQRAKDLLQAPRTAGGHPWIEPKRTDVPAQRFAICTYRLSFATQADLRAAARKHDVDQVQIVRPAIRDYAEKLLAMPRSKSS